MNINMKMIYNFLKNYQPTLHLSQKDFLDINNVVWLKGFEQDFKSNLLYVSKASDLIKLQPIETPLNVVCLSDIPLSFDINDKLNLIVVDPSLEITNIYNDINSYIINQAHINNNCTKLYDALLSGKGLQYIVNVATEVLENPIMVFNRAHKILAYSNTVVVNSPLWNEMTANGYGNFDHYKLYEEEFKKAEKADYPIIQNFDDFHGLITKIKIGGKHVGYVSGPNYIRPFYENDFELMKLLSKLIAVELQKDNLISQTKGLMYEHLITELLDSENLNKKYLQDRVNFLDLNLKENLYVLTARPIAGKVDSLPFYREVLGSLIFDSKSVLYNNDIIFLITRKKNKPLIQSDLADALKFIEENNMQAGLSRCFHDISHIRRFYIQSYKAIEIGNQIRQDEFLFMYDQYALPHLLDIAAEQSDLKDFCNNHVFDLIEYDKVNHTKFTQTLYIYLSCGCDVAKTAQIFNIHRNTLDYRIKKVEELLEIDINDAETHFALYSSYKILSFIKDEEFLATIKSS